MNDELESEERCVLAEARGALAPTREQIRRVLAATRRAARTGPGVRQAAEAPVTQQLQAPRMAAGADPKKLLAVFVCIVAAFGFGGYVLRDRPAPKPSEPAASSGHAGTRLQVSVGAGQQDHSEPTGAIRGAATGGREAPSPADVGAPAEQPRAPYSQHGTRSVRPTRVVDQADLELRALRRIERALRENAPQLALSRLADLDRRVPGGQLREERLAAYTVARCALEATSQSALLGQFTARHPASVYLPRVKHSCTSLQPSANTSPRQEKSRRVIEAEDTHK